jgi:hypothetical protein
VQADRITPMSTVEPKAPVATAAAKPPPPAKLDDVMLAMDVVDTLRHRDLLVERELNDEVREEQLIERLRALYKSQGIDVPDHIIEEGVRGLKESRFAYTPPKPGLLRTLALLWVRRSLYGKLSAAAVALIALLIGAYQFGVVRPAQQAAEAARIELSDTLPRELVAAHQAVIAEAQVPAARERADAVRAQGASAIGRSNVADARAAIAELDALGSALRQEYVLRIAGRPEDDTGFFREHPSFQGRAYFVVVDAIDPRGSPVRLPIRNDETNETETVSRFAVRVPIATFNAVRNDKATNGIVQNARLAEKRRGYLEPEFAMPVLDGRITRW